MSGAMTLSALEITKEASFDNLKNVSEIRDPKVAFFSLSTIIPVGISGMSVIYMFTGFVLLFAALTDQEGLVQVFVWLIFLAIVIGYLLVFLIGLECMTMKNCTLGGLDWLSASAVLTIICVYLAVWFYLICVANTFVVNGG
ncbi:uncharacterized protein LOC106130970 [Amyelois transitella]|uniref:uncharacterized protein LOC106130970 n=1 Tax=Amyelois transitella TaxID=680683 RepID=UPI00067D1BFA|nr:uncharacterized protein LOC106130970 [Amyelois transitella]XP_060807071.1 uncharacterized protein LOC106130970 [Amyelois transitella]